MSHVSLHLITERAKARIGRLAQIAALPPQPRRHAGDHWQLNRAPFARGYYGERADLRFSKESPALTRAKEELEDLGAPLDIIEDLTLDDFLVTPEFITGTVAGFTFKTRIAEPRKTQQLPTPEYQILQTGGSLNLSLGGPDKLFSVAQPLMTSKNYPRPCQVEAITIGWSGQDVPAMIVSLSVPELNFNYTQLANSALLTDGIANSTTFPFKVLTPAGFDAVLQINSNDSNSPEDFSAHASITYRHARIKS